MYTSVHKNGSNGNKNTIVETINYLLILKERA